MFESVWREASEEDLTQLWVMGETGNLLSASVSVVLWPHGGKNPGPRQRITIQPQQHRWMKKIESGSPRYVLTLDLPFVAKEDVDLAVASGDLIVRIGNVRHHVPIPRTLAGVRAWVVKPFQPDQLLGAVAKLVNRVGIDGATLTVYEDDDTTTLGEQALTSDADAEPVTGANTV